MRSHCVEAGSGTPKCLCHLAVRYIGWPAPKRWRFNLTPQLGSYLASPASGGAGAVKRAPHKAQRNRSSSKTVALKMGWATTRTIRAGVLSRYTRRG